MANMMPPRHMLPPDQGPNPQLVKKIVKELKINGVFDEMRKECLADIDTKPAFSNLKQRVEGHVKGILANQHWSPSLNKNQLRSMIRESVMQSGILNEGVDRILYQVFSAKACPVFLPKIKEFVKERGEELMKEFLPPPMEIPPVMMNPLPFEPPPIPISPEVQPELFPPPMPPSQPPPPDSPIIPGSDDHFKGEEGSVQDPTEQVETIHEVSEEILTYEDQEFYVKDVAPEDVVVKAINTPSPHPSTPESADENTPKIPEEAVNPLRSLIQSLLVSKQTILETTENEIQEPDYKNMTVQQGKVKVEGRSPTIDPSQIEGFTDDDEEEVEEYIPAPGPKTPTDEDDAYEPLEPTTQQPPTPHSEETSPQSEPRTPSGVYSPLSPGQVFDDSRGNAEKISQVQIEKDRQSDSDSRMTDERSTPAYDPSKFSYQQMSDSTPLNEDDNDQSPPSPTEITDTTEKSQYTDEATHYRSEGSRYDTDMKENRVVQNLQRSQKHKKKRRSSSDSSESSSGSVSSSPSSKDENDQTIVVQEQVVEQEVEEMVEEIEVVEEFTSGGSAEEGEQLKSESEQEEEQVQQRVVKSPKDKKRKKKTKKRKAKKPKKRARTSSISSGEITSSNELSSDSSSGLNRPTRPTQPPRKKSLDLGELEEKRRILREESMHDRPYWANTASSSEYLSSPGRIPRPYSPRRPYSPDFHRYKDDLGYGPPPVPHFRDRPMFPGEYHPRHARLSPPPYRRSPPHRYSPGLRMDYPRMPFGSPRSPPRRPYSPPRMMGGYPRERPPFPHPHHRWRSPPRPGPRRPSRSPPPVMRRDDGPGPSRY